MGTKLQIADLLTKQFSRFECWTPLLYQAFLFHPNDSRARPEKVCLEKPKRPAKGATTCLRAAVARLKTLSTCASNSHLSPPLSERGEICAMAPPSTSNTWPAAVTDFIGYEAYHANEASPIRLSWWTWACNLVQALQACGYGFTFAAGHNYETLPGLITLLQNEPGQWPLIFGGKPPLSAGGPLEEPPTDIDWKSVASAWLRQDPESDMTNIAVRHKGGQKYLQDSLPAGDPTIDRAHVIADSTLCFGTGQVNMDAPFRRSAIEAKEFELGVYAHRKGGDLGHMASMALEVLIKELEVMRGETPAHDLWGAVPPPSRTFSSAAD